jgi:general secretion pathway protein G
MIGGQRESRRFFQKKRAGIRQRGFMLYELIVAIIIIGVLAGVLLQRLQYYQEYAKQTARDVTLRNMRNGLRLQVADLMMHDRMNDAVKLLKQNPITWLEKLPPNYIGELTAPHEDAISPDSWYFDLSRQELIYVSAGRRFFDYPTNAEKPLRYRVTAVTVPQGKNNDVAPKIEGLSLMLINQY